jgi:hypothetical protein
MSENGISDNRHLIIDDVNLDNILANGPSAPKPGVVPKIPSMPQQVREQVEEKKAESPEVPVPDEGPDDEMKEQMVLPDEKTKADLKARYGLLRVVPIPYMRQDGKIQTYILRQLTRSQWRATEDMATKIAESKPGIPAEEIFQEKIIATAVVWPHFDETEIKLTPPGLVPTLFGIVQQMGLFFNPEAIMAVTFTL